MSALYPCPLCHQQVPTRLAPSGTVRLVRHVQSGTSRPGVPGVSCLGTGWQVMAS